MWWHEVEPGLGRRQAMAALAQVDRLTLGRLFGLPDDARGDLRPLFPELSGPRPGGGWTGRHAATYRPEDGRALRVVTARATFGDRMGFLRADGSDPTPGSPEARADALVARAVAAGRPAALPDAEAVAAASRPIPTAACALPFGERHARLALTRAELGEAVSALGGGPRPSSAVARFVARNASAVAQPVFDRDQDTGVSRLGADGARMLLDGFGVNSQFRTLRLDAAALLSRPGAAEGLGAALAGCAGRAPARDRAAARPARLPRARAEAALGVA